MDLWSWPSLKISKDESSLETKETGKKLAERRDDKLICRHGKGISWAVSLASFTGTKFTWEDFLIITEGCKESVCQGWCDNNGLDREIPLLSRHRRSEPCAVAVHSLLREELWLWHCAGCVTWRSVKTLGWAGPAPSGKSVSFSFSSLGMPAVLACPEGHLSECWTEFYLLSAAPSFDLQRVIKNFDVWFSLKWERSASKCA